MENMTDPQTMGYWGFDHCHINLMAVDGNELIFPFDENNHLPYMLKDDHTHFAPTSLTYQRLLPLKMHKASSAKTTTTFLRRRKNYYWHISDLATLVSAGYRT